MITLTYGFKVPETNDKASVVFPALEANFTRLDSHDHDGTNSKKLTGSAKESTVVAVSSASWGADLGGGYYKQTVNVPTGIDYDSGTVEVRLSTGERIYPRVVKVSGAQADIYVSDNTLNLVVLFN